MACKTLGNSGVPNCSYLIRNVRTLMLQSLIGADGSANKFDLVSDVTKTNMQAKFDAAEQDDRIYPIHGWKNVAQTRSDSEIEELTDASRVFIRNGVVTFEGYLVDPHPYLLQKLEQWRGEEFGVYIGDALDQFVYETDEDTLKEVKPVPIDGGSWDITEVPAQETESRKFKLTFNFSVTDQAQLLRRIEKKDLDFSPTSKIDVYGLTDVDKLAEYVSAGATESVITLTTDFGDPVTGLTLTSGFESANAVYNVTQDAAATLSAVVESPSGTYTLTYGGTNTSGDTMRVTPVKPRFDFNNGDGYELAIP